MIERENREKPLGLTPSPQGSHLQEKGAIRAREALPLMEKKKVLLHWSRPYITKPRLYLWIKVIEKKNLFNLREAEK